MKITIRRQDDAFHFRSANESGLTVDTDSSGGEGPAKGVTPLELLLVALGSCSGIDVVDILKKGRQKIETFDATVTADRDGGKPVSMITAMHVRFDLTGDLDSEKVRRAIELSIGKYCTVSKMLSPAADISTSFSINNVVFI